MPHITCILLKRVYVQKEADGLQYNVLQSFPFWVDALSKESRMHCLLIAACKLMELDFSTMHNMKHVKEFR